jgi:hypothetical protein
MSVDTATAPSFSCGECGKEFRWKPAIAGKSAKCGCGAKVQVPATEPGRAPPPLPQQDDDENSIFAGLEAVVAAAPVTLPPPVPVKEEPVKAPRTIGKAGGKKSAPAMAAGGAKSAANPRFHQRTSVGLSRQEVEDMRNLSFWGLPKERVVPLIMLGASMMVFFGAYAFSKNSSGELMLLMTVYSVVCAIGLTAAAFVTAGVAGMSFGIMGIGILRLMAISYATLAVNAVFDVMAIPFTGFINSAITYAIFTFGLMGFFGLDYAETRVVAFVSMILKFVFGFAAIFLVGFLLAAGGHHRSDDLDSDEADDSDTTAVITREKAEKPHADAGQQPKPADADEEDKGK